MTDSIDVPFMLHRRLQRLAVANLGNTWSARHDRFVINQLFRQGIITNYQREEQLERIATKVRAARQRDPNHGRWRLW